MVSRDAQADRPESRAGSAESSQCFDCLAGSAGALRPCTREVMVELPLRILVNGEPVATLMQTPGAETELALGFLMTEGWIRSFSDVGAISFCPEGQLGAAGEARVLLAAGCPTNRRGYREVFSSCGLCGDTLLDEFARSLPVVERPARRLRPADVFRLRDAMEAAQQAFRQTGGTHAAALAEVPVGEGTGRLVVREDLGRHNALDKAVGAAMRMSFCLDRSLVFLSGRLSFEMVTKAAQAGIGDLAGVSAPSALGVALARRLGMFLAGFVRGESMTVYSGADALAESGTA